MRNMRAAPAAPCLRYGARCHITLVFSSKRSMPSTHPKAYLAFDFGAESGRAVLAHLHSGVVTIDEVHRFANDPVEYGGSLHWDLPRLWFELRAALSAVEDTDIAGIGVDSWGVDYALIGEGGELLQNPYHYRDTRNIAAMREVLQLISQEDIQEATGIPL